MANFKCYAPVFPKRNGFACIFEALSNAAAISMMLIGTLFLILLSGKGRCLLKRYAFRLKHCREGNSNSKWEI